MFIRSQTVPAHLCDANEKDSASCARRKPFVYIMSRSKTLYTGITNSLIRRVREHNLVIGSGGATKYKIDRLVYFERFEDVHRAIAARRRSRAGCGAGRSS
jgi:putative endonuclease